jgi:hypothetical protein
MQLLTSFVDTVAIGAIHDKNQALGTSIVVPPEWPDFLLTPNVPDVKLDILVGDRFHVKSNFQLLSLVEAVNRSVVPHLLGWW